MYVYVVVVGWHHLIMEIQQAGKGGRVQNRYTTKRGGDRGEVGTTTSTSKHTTTRDPIPCQVAWDGMDEMETHDDDMKSRCGWDERRAANGEWRDAECDGSY